MLVKHFRRILHTIDIWPHDTHRFRYMRIILSITLKKLRPGKEILPRFFHTYPSPPPPELFLSK